MKKLLLLPVMLLGAFTAATAQGPVTTPTVDNPNAPEMKFEVLDHNFGTIKQGDAATYEFKFKNSGKEPLIITSASGSCGCTVPDWPKDPIRPGGSGTIKVTFNSAGKMGAQDKTVTLISNAKEGTLVLHMKGTVEAKPVDPAQTVPTGSTGTGTATGGKETKTVPATTATTKETKAVPATSTGGKTSPATSPKAATTTSTKESPKTVTATPPATKEAPKTSTPK
ncbi:MAG: hypothetical protein FD123_3675 [Bacteroidetes bacterium]|nr:MAG: hypothetical protein FD123_3675 [Bacteroidota bacterium]